MNVLVLSPYPSEILFTLKREGDIYIIHTEELTLDLLERNSIEYIISYGYKFIISKEIIEYMHNNIINLHISYLPYNKGYYPNLWSHIDSTPCGVSIHKIDEGIDTGSIIFRKPVEIIVKNHTFESSYTLLRGEVEKLFNEKWKEIKKNNFKIVKIDSKGSYHSKSQGDKILSLLEAGWKTNILKALEVIKKNKSLALD